MNHYNLPTSLKDALRNPKKFAEMVRMLDSLQRLRVRNSDGREGYIQFSQRDAVINLAGGTGGGAVPPVEPTLHPETVLWRDRILAAGGTVTDARIAWTDEFIIAFNALSFHSKIIYLLPYLGSDLTAARVPTRDILGAGIADNGNFSESDFDEARGLKGNGTNKYLDIKIAPSDIEAQLGIVRQIGYGWWDTKLVDTLTADRYVMGSYDGSGQNIMRSLASGVVDFQAGFFINPFVQCTTFKQKGHWYAQRTTPSDRKGFVDGVLFDTETVADNTAFSNQDIALFAFRDIPANGGVREWYAGRGAVAYVTTGDLTDAEVLELHTFLNDYLITPLGRMLDDSDVLEGGSAADEYTDILDGGSAADEFTTIYTGQPVP